MADPELHVPSLNRSLLLPWLDTQEVQGGGEHSADPTPMGANWLFTPLPYISGGDLEGETVTIYNPSLFRGASLEGCTLTDRLERHKYSFPAGCVLRARRSLTLFCCPGKLSEGDLEDLPVASLLWKNQDGSLRRKEVMDNTGDSLVLSDARGREISSLELPGSDDAGEPYMQLPGVKLAQVMALRNLVLMFCYFRLACIGAAAFWVSANPDVFLLFTALAHVLDIFSRWGSSQPGVPMDNLGAVLATMGDRLSALVLVGSLVLLDSDARHSKAFAFMLVLDLTANWLQLSVASTAGGPHPLAGISIRGREAAPDFSTYLMLRHSFALTLVSLGNEAFLLWSYLLASSGLPLGLRPMAEKAGVFVSRWISDISHSLSFLPPLFSPDARSSSPSLMSAEADGDVGGALGGFEPNRDIPAMLGLDGELQTGKSEDDEGSVVATVWRGMWMALMVCCACRQLLSCIQALISMSSLSSGVIGEAAGKDMQRTRPGPRRSRSTRPVGRDSYGGVDGGGFRNGDGGGVGSASSASRPRGRSRVR